MKHVDGDYNYYFNSSMVRLKDVISNVVPGLAVIFQFLNGAIKRKLLNLKNHILANFNSSMVRLKVLTTLPLFETSGVFQFLNGAIKRCISLVVRSIAL